MAPNRLTSTMVRKSPMELHSISAQSVMPALFTTAHSPDGAYRLLLENDVHCADLIVFLMHYWRLSKSQQRVQPPWNHLIWSDDILFQKALQDINAWWWTHENGTEVVKIMLQCNRANILIYSVLVLRDKVKILSYMLWSYEIVSYETKPRVKSNFWVFYFCVSV